MKVKSFVLGSEVSEHIKVIGNVFDGIKEERKMVSNHYKIKRNSREEFINKYLGGDGRMVDGFVIDKGHRNGLEVHSVTENGVIIIHNLSVANFVQNS